MKYYFFFGIFTLIVYAIILFMMQVYLLNTYWIFLLIFIVVLSIFYLKNGSDFIIILNLYILMLVNIMMCDFNIFCKDLKYTIDLMYYLFAFLAL